MTFASSSVKLACACGRVTGYQDGMVVPPGAMSLLQSGMDDKLIWMVVALIVAAGRASLCSLLPIAFGAAARSKRSSHFRVPLCCYRQWDDPSHRPRPALRG